MANNFKKARKRAKTFLEFFLAIVVCTFLTVHCGEVSSDHEETSALADRDAVNEIPLDPKGVKLLYSIGDDSSTFFYQVMSILVRQNPHPMLYAMDRGSYQIKLFDDKGRFVKAEGAKGTGPGYFQSPTFLGSTRDFLIVSEQYSLRAHIYTPDLHYQRDVLLETYAVDMSTLADTLLFICGILPASMESCQLGIFSFSPPKFVSWTLAEKEKFPSFLWTFAQVAAYGDRTWVAFMYQNRIICFNNGKIVWEKFVDSLPVQAEGKKRNNMSLPIDKIFYDITVDEDGYSYVLSGEYAENPGNLIWVLSPEGEYVDTLLLPRKATSIAWGNPSKLYTIDKNRIRVSCYMLTSETIRSHKTTAMKAGL